MVLRYNTTTFVITNFNADGGDTALRAEILAYYMAHLGTGENAFGLSDDVSVLAAPQNYLVVESMSVPTGTERKKSILITPSASSMFMNEEVVLAIQLRDKNLNPDAVSTTVTLSCSNGIIVPATVVTNGSGYSNVAVLKPNKFMGDIVVDASVATYQGWPVTITVTAPDNLDEQQWLEGADIRDGAITGNKEAGKRNLRSGSFAPFWFCNKASVVQTFDPGLYGSMNSIVADDMGFIYVNGFQTVAVNDPAVVKLDKNKGTVISTKPYTTYNLTSRFDGMCYDGTNIWVAGGCHLYKIDALDMATIVDYTPDSVADGNFQFLIWDGEFIWTQLRGGTHGHADQIWKLYPDGTVAAQIDYRTGDPFGTSVRDIKQVAIDEDYLYIVATGAAVSDWIRIKRSDNSIVYRDDDDDYGAYGIAIAEPDHMIYISGGSAGGEEQLTLEQTDIYPRGIAFNWNVARWYDLAFDGKYVWGISSSGIGVTGRQYLRKMQKPDLTATTIPLGESFDLTTSLDPTSLAFGPPHLYVAGFGSGANCRIKKVFVGN